MKHSLYKSLNFPQQNISAGLGKNFGKLYLVTCGEGRLEWQLCTGQWPPGTRIFCSARSPSTWDQGQCQEIFPPFWISERNSFVWMYPKPTREVACGTTAQNQLIEPVLSGWSKSLRPYFPKNWAVFERASAENISIKKTYEKNFKLKKNSSKRCGFVPISKKI